MRIFNIKKAEGVVLITTLLILAILIAVVVQFNRVTTAEVIVAQNYGNGKKALYISISGLNAIKELLYLDSLYTKSDSLLEPWAKITPYIESANSELEEGSINVVITDECGKLPVNMLVDDKGRFNPLYHDIWERFLSQRRFALTEDQVMTILESIKDWIDVDDDVTGIYGAESSFYMEKGYRCKNGPINCLSELLLINGIDNSIFYGDEYRDGISKYITPYGNGKININTAPIPVLMALSDNMTEEKAYEFDSFRNDPINKDLLNSYAWYKNVWPFEKALPESILTTNSDFFSVYITGRVEDSKKDVMAVLSRKGGRVSVIYWKEE